MTTALWRSLQTTTRNTTTNLHRTMTSTAAHTSRTPQKIVYARETPEGMGATVRRSIGTPALRNLSPFLMLDHAKVQPDSGFPDHPHRGMTTVTYVLSGKMQHEDFMGNSGALEPGDVQWMTAGRGVVHSEMPLFDEDPAKRVEAEALQLWVDLPAAQKMIEPSYQEKKAADIDTAHPAPGVEVTVISGESNGVKGFVRPVGGCWFLDFKLKPGASTFQPIPKGWTAFVYVIKGSLKIGDASTTPVKQFHTATLTANDDQDGVLLTAPENAHAPDDTTRFIVVAGEPLDQPVVQYGPFVVTSQEEAVAAIVDFNSGKNGFEGAANWESKIGAPLRRAHSRH